MATRTTICILHALRGLLLHTLLHRIGVLLRSLHHRVPVRLICLRHRLRVLK